MEGNHRPACVEALLALLEREAELFQRTSGGDSHQHLDVCRHLVELSCSHALWSVKAKEDLSAMALLEKTNALLALHSNAMGQRQPHDSLHVTWLELRLRVAKQLGSVSRRILALDETMKFVYDAMAIEYSLFDVLSTDKNSRERLLRHRTSIAKAHMQIADFFASAQEHAAAAVNAQHAASMLFEALVVWTKLDDAAQDNSVRDEVAWKLALALHSYGAELEQLDEASNALQAYRKAFEISAACFGKDHDGTKSMSRTLQSFSMALKEGPLSPPKKCPSPPHALPAAHDKQDRWRSSTLWPALLKRLHNNYTDDAIELSPPKKPLPPKVGPTSIAKPKPAPVVANPMTSMFAPKNITYAPVLQRDPRAIDAPTPHKSHQRPTTAKSPWNMNVSPSKGSATTTFVTIQSPYDTTAARPPSSSTPHRPKTAGFVKRIPPGQSPLTCYSPRQPPKPVAPTPHPPTNPTDVEPIGKVSPSDDDASAPREGGSKDITAVPTPVAKLQATLKLAETIAAASEPHEEHPTSARSKLLAKREQRLRERRPSSPAPVTPPPDEPTGLIYSYQGADVSSHDTADSPTIQVQTSAQIAPVASASTQLARQHSEPALDAGVQGASGPELLGPALLLAFAVDANETTPMSPEDHRKKESTEAEQRSTSGGAALTHAEPTRTEFVRKLSSQVVEDLLRSASTSQAAQTIPGPSHIVIDALPAAEAGKGHTTTAKESTERHGCLEVAMDGGMGASPIGQITTRSHPYDRQDVAELSTLVPAIDAEIAAPNRVDTCQIEPTPRRELLHIADNNADLLRELPRNVQVDGVGINGPTLTSDLSSALPNAPACGNPQPSGLVQTLARQFTERICRAAMETVVVPAVTSSRGNISGPESMLLSQSPAPPRSRTHSDSSDDGGPFDLFSPPSTSSVTYATSADESTCRARSSRSRRRGRRRQQSSSCSSSSSTSSRSSSSAESSSSHTDSSHVSLGTASSSSSPSDDDTDDDLGDGTCFSTSSQFVPPLSNCPLAPDGPTSDLTSPPSAATTGSATSLLGPGEDISAATAPPSVAVELVGVDGATQFPSPTTDN